MKIKMLIVFTEKSLFNFGRMQFLVSTRYGQRKGCLKLKYVEHVLTFLLNKVKCTFGFQKVSIMKRGQHEPEKEQSLPEFTNYVVCVNGVLLHPEWSRWETYLGCCSQGDEARILRIRRGVLGGCTHSALIPTTSLWSSNAVQTHQTPANSSTRQLLYIHYRTHGSRDKQRYHVRSAYKEIKA
jgi:hypothetical protein